MRFKVHFGSANIFVILVALLIFPVSSSNANVPRPGWLNVDRSTIEEYMELARQRHAQAIQKAKNSYNIGAATKYPPDQSILSHVRLKAHVVESSGRLPDFQEELEKKLFVTSPKPLFTREECKDCIDKAEAHFAAKNEPWSTLPSGQYDVAGFWIRDVPEVYGWFLQMLQKRLLPLLATTFPHFCESLDDLVVDNAYLFKYTPETGRRTDVHTDSGCLSFTISLNSNDEYLGGGTWFEGLQKDPQNTSVSGMSNVIEMDIGQCTVRPGGVRHRGHAVTKGTRYIIGGFCMQKRKVEYVRMLLNIGQEANTVQERQTALEVAIALNPGFDGPYTNLADLLQQEGQTAKAKQVLEYCLENVNPQCGEVAYTLGNIYLEEECYEQAKKCMHICLDADESDVDAMMIMAQVGAAQRDQEAELSWYELIISTPGAANKTLASAYCNLGVLHEGQDQEMEYYRKSLALEPETFAPRYSLASTYASRKQWTAAVQEFRAALAYGKGTEKEERQALQSLYRVAVEKIRSDFPQGLSSREAMLEKFQEIMGQENYNKLAATAKK